MELRTIKNHAQLRYQPGDRAGGFTVIAAIGAKHFRKGVAVIFEVRCDCGAVTTRDRQSLIKHEAGCEFCKKPGTAPHGASSHPLYKRWRHMIERCTKPTDQDFHNYGARGIQVCDRWRLGADGKTGFECFVSDMGPCPPRLTLERCDNHAHYTPENCRWASRTVQSRNRRSLRMLEWQGRVQPASVWAIEHGIPYFTLMRRLGLGWSVERALTEAIHPR